MIGIFIQARSGGTRLPGKVLLPLHDGRNSIQLMWDKISKWISQNDYKIVFKFLIDIKDERLKSYCDSNKIEYHAMDRDNDLLKQYYQAAVDYKCDCIIRLTGDCPLLDVALLKSVIDGLMSQENNMLVTNSFLGQEMYPDGMDITGCTFKLLEDSYKNAVGKDREHVMTYAMNKIGISMYQISHSPNLSKWRLTLDTQEDYDVIKQIPTNLNMYEIIDYVIKHELYGNLHHMRNESYYKQKDNE